MKVDSLREYLVFGESLNYSQAARKLHISQSCLSKHISELASEIGVPLVKQGQRAELTPAGEALLQLASHFIYEHDHIVEECRRADSDGVERLRVQLPNAQDRTQIIFYDFVSESLNRGFYTLRLHDITESPIRAIEKSLIDVGLFRSFDGGLDHIDTRAGVSLRLVPIARERAGVVLAKDNPLATAAGPLELGALEGTSFIVPAQDKLELERIAAESFFAISGLTPRYSIRSMDSLMEYIGLPFNNDMAVLTGPTSDKPYDHPANRPDNRMRFDTEPAIFITSYVMSREDTPSRAADDLVDNLRLRIAEKAASDSSGYYQVVR